MFQGSAEVSIDAKGRLSVPSKHRDALLAGGQALVLAAHPDGCLLLYPRAAYEPIAAHLQSLNAFNKQIRWWQRLVIGLAEPIELDAQSRFLVSNTLRKFASLQKDVTFFGQGNRFEIWDTTRFESKLDGEISEAGSTPPPGMENFSL